MGVWVKVCNRKGTDINCNLKELWGNKKKLLKNCNSTINSDLNRFRLLIEFRIRKLRMDLLNFNIF